jgi:carbon storage regulator CsrA
MLALSRRPGERILFPNLNIEVEIVQVKGNSVKVGISAPPDVAILRAEVAAREAAAREAAAHEVAAHGSLAAKPKHAAAAPETPKQAVKLSHEQRNRLNSAALALHVVEKQLQAGMIGNAETTLQSAIKLLESVDDSVHGAGQPEVRTKDIAALLVEDDPVEESLLTSFLRLNGFCVATVRDGYEALEYLASHPRPDFVLLDMRLPRLNGPATISAIRRNPELSGVRIFAVTGLTQDEAGVVTGPDGVDGWFQKPLNPSRLAEAMSAAAARN